MSDSTPLDLPPAIVGPLSLRLAAANGDPSAEFQVGARLAEAKGPAQNFAEAAKWYQRAASKDFAQAQYRLGTLYERGLGIKTDPAKAESWYKRAAELGNIKAMHNLAVMSANQSKDSPDYATAGQWFSEAASRGLADSQFNLAVLHENGLGVPQDLKQAYKWLALAARSGDKEAIRRRDILKGKLTASDMVAAEELIKIWKAKPAEPMANDARIAGEAWKKNPANGVSG
jgi:localization factor PodJL